MRPISQAVERAFGPAANFCTTCCGPDPSAPLVIMLANGLEPGECEECGRTTDPDGRCLERSTTDRYFKVIYLEDEDP